MDTKAPTDQLTNETDARTEARVQAWAASGLMAITGWPREPLPRPIGPPAGLMPFLDALSARLSTLDIAALLGERAAIAGLTSGGDISCGGACRILRTADGFLAVSLPRPEDIELVPAWLRDDWSGETDLWSFITRHVAVTNTRELIERGVLLQMAVASPGEAGDRPPVIKTRIDHPGTAPGLDGAVVVDLSGLWAGPLCTHLLLHHNARVIKVESLSRPDGARLGPEAFFGILNAGKEFVALDFRTASGLAELEELLMLADLVVASSRPRAFTQMGIDPASMISRGGPRVWASITAHGIDGEGRHRVGFGDDAAVAGGLVVWDGDQPLFCADAIADPLAGIAAAVACMDAVATGFSGIIDVSLAAVAKAAAGPTLRVEPGTVASPPRARVPAASARELGADTEHVLSQLGIRP